MGLYNIIKNFSLPCPTCNNVLSEFQTKEGLLALDEVPFYTVNNFYDVCAHCGTKMEFTYSIEKLESVKKLFDYNVEVTEDEHGES